MNIEDLKRGVLLLDQVDNANSTLERLNKAYKEVENPKSFVGAVTLEFGGLTTIGHISVSNEVMLKIIQSIADYYFTQLNISEQEIKRM